MQRAGLHGLPGNRRSRAQHVTPSVTDLVERNFTRHARDQLWVTDITEHPTLEGKVYCAVVLDTFSRRVVGRSVDAAPNEVLLGPAPGRTAQPKTVADASGTVHRAGTPRRACSARWSTNSAPCQ